MKFTEQLFTGRAGWAEQLLYSASILERSNREFVHPNSVFKDQIAQAVSWDVPDDSIRLKFDFPIQQRLLVGEDSPAHRIYAYNPTEAIDAGVDRDLAAEYKGLPVSSALLAPEQLLSLEQRTAHLLYAWEIQQEIIKEWNFFADLQENLWLTILAAEGSSVDSGLIQVYNLSEAERIKLYEIALFATTPQPPWIRDIDRANYESAITQWLLDSGTTARSGGVAVDNDTYILWLTERLQDITTTWAQVAPQASDLNYAPYIKNSAPYLGQTATMLIDPRYVYRYAPFIVRDVAGDAGGGATGAADSGAPDPADSGKSGLDLLEELASREGGLNAELGSGSSSAPINTLPEC